MLLLFWRGLAVCQTPWADPEDITTDWLDSELVPDIGGSEPVAGGGLALVVISDQDAVSDWQDAEEPTTEWSDSEEPLPFCS